MDLPSYEALQWNEQNVLQYYKQASKKYHPDRPCGSHDKFIALQKWLEMYYQSAKCIPDNPEGTLPDSIEAYELTDYIRHLVQKKMNINDIIAPIVSVSETAWGHLRHSQWSTILTEDLLTQIKDVRNRIIEIPFERIEHLSGYVNIKLSQKRFCNCFKKSIKCRSFSQCTQCTNFLIEKKKVISFRRPELEQLPLKYKWKNYGHLVFEGKNINDAIHNAYIQDLLVVIY